jgi:RNA polymerase sigma-54 factor
METEGIVQVQRQVFRQEQRLRMTPQLYQAIRILALPVQELKLSIEEELERNPALEVLEDKTTVSLEENLQKDTDSEEEGYFDDASDSGYGRSRSSDDDDAKKKFIEGVAARPESLQEHLMQQLRVQPIDSDAFVAGEILIRNLDENGFNREAVETLFPPERRELASRMVQMIRAFDPVGCCTADYRESLLVQILLHPSPHPRASEIIERHLELAERGKHKEIARKMKTDEEEVRSALEFIRGLEPIPGRNFSTDAPKYVIPDVMVKMQDGQFVIYLNDEAIPVLGVNPFFRDLLKGKEKEQEKAKDKRREVKKFVSSRLQDARWFIRSIQQRNETLLKVSRAIIEFQRDFFRRGPKYLVPLTLKDIAQQVDVHEATVSRITNGKYMQTEWGIFELKYFFSNPVSTVRPDGSHFSKEGVKQVVKEIIEQEGGDKHLPDNKIVELLASRGIHIARRTVAKYRTELDIMSSYRR